MSAVVIMGMMFVAGVMLGALVVASFGGKLRRRVRACRVDQPDQLAREAQELWGDLPSPSQAPAAQPIAHPVVPVPTCAACGDDATRHAAECAGENAYRAPWTHAFSLAPDDAPMLCCSCYRSAQSVEQIADQVRTRRRAMGGMNQ